MSCQPAGRVFWYEQDVQKGVPFAVALEVDVPDWGLGPTVVGRCAGLLNCGWEVVTVSGDGDGEDAVARSARRRPHALARRSRRVVVKVNDAEYERLASMAEGQGLSIARLMIRSTFSGGSVAAMKSQLVHDDVRGLIRLMGRQGVLLNQLTAATNSTGQAPLELEPTLRSMQRVIARTEALADSLDPSA